MSESSSQPVSLLDQFQQYSAVLESESTKRNAIKENTKELDEHVRSLEAALQEIHSDSDALPAIVAAVAAAEPALQACFGRIGALLEAGEYYRYKGMWQSVVRDLVAVLVLVHWLENGELLALPRAAERLALRAGVTDGSALALELEDYLFGVACAPSELERLAINSVTRGDYDAPARIARFVKQLYTAFQRLTMRNDPLRRKYDTIKYSVNKVEGILFDLKIRGLATVEAPATTLAE